MYFTITLSQWAILRTVICHHLQLLKSSSLRQQLPIFLPHPLSIPTDSFLEALIDFRPWILFLLLPDKSSQSISSLICLELMTKHFNVLSQALKRYLCYMPVHWASLAMHLDLQYQHNELHNDCILFFLSCFRVESTALFGNPLIHLYHALSHSSKTDRSSSFLKLPASPSCCA